MNNFVYHKPAYKMIQELRDAKLISFAGDIALMCPKCFNMIETNLSYTKEINNSDDFIINNCYYGTCPKCEKDVKFEEIDANMAQIINILNSKGYYTAFCCEGHIQPDETSNREEFQLPYIYFYLWTDTEILNEHPLPDSWYINQINKKANIFCIHDIIDAEMPKCFETQKDHDDCIEWVKNNWYQKQALEDIYNWAVSLPNRTRNQKRYNRIMINHHGDIIINSNARKYIKYYNEEIDNPRE